MEVRSLLKIYLTEAKHQLNEDIAQKADIIKLIKQLLASGIDKTKIENVTNFYKFSLNSSNYDVINNSTYQELKSKLENLGKEEGIILPQENM